MQFRPTEDTAITDIIPITFIITITDTVVALAITDTINNLHRRKPTFSLYIREVREVRKLGKENFFPRWLSKKGAIEALRDYLLLLVKLRKAAALDLEHFSHTPH
tara:strand:- start:4196 stop:4510 length:315 start_codon:yes stop_codon:yes gene_type:complete